MQNLDLSPIFTQKLQENFSKKLAKFLENPERKSPKNSLSRRQKRSTFTSSKTVKKIVISHPSIRKTWQILCFAPCLNSLQPREKKAQETIQKMVEKCNYNYILPFLLLLFERKNARIITCFWMRTHKLWKKRVDFFHKNGLELPPKPHPNWTTLTFNHFALVSLFNRCHFVTRFVTHLSCAFVCVCLGTWWTSEGKRRFKQPE